MFIQVAKEVGGTCNLAPIQRLDLLVRDWQPSGAYGADAGQEYLGEITQMAEAFAVMRQELNRRAVEATRREYDQFVQELDRDHQSTSSCLRVKPVEMQRRLEGKRQELLERCQAELRGEDPQKQAALEELKQELDKQMDQFLSAYGQHFKVKKAEWLGLYIGPSPGATARWARARPHWPAHLPISKRLRPIGCLFRRWDGRRKRCWDL
ncbi:uncharacterized protein LOC117882933 isoform X2 [Trachemys scripta elegans]|uniref:uncharacterized protein LOC117882933 isoform X2 n=1 Tax=Trachemys scripta elegans TaxID=31138 RepID=UPI0015549F89|nr:uncharacterized protein LOC117882933 isoform X2 [Trachemys scripta elegans]